MREKTLLKNMFIAGIALSILLLQTSSVFGQTDQQNILTVNVKDGVTGGTAEGVNINIVSSTGQEILTTATTPGQPTQIQLPPGTYNVNIQLPLFGIPITVGSQTVTMNQTTNLAFTISAIFIPMKYVALLIYIIVILLIIAIIVSVINGRRKKPEKILIVPSSASK
jgi:hypothetical protein